ncbi:DUF417 family protein [Microbulbifer echini]|uniref:DUF417 family protein n=1 Tax=Microbulbifer echini TaxID=1529067 RepID=A0ABV4NIS7_9GAMM
MNIRLQKLISALLGLSFALIAIAIFSGQQGGLASIFRFYGISQASDLTVAGIASATIFMVAAVLALLSFLHRKWMRVLALWMIVLSVVPLLSLFGSAHWIESLGGFPALGSGQGVIKYFALVAIGLTLLSHNTLQSRLYIWLNFLPVGLVLLWIGGMKFTAIEAQGIEGLVSSSPLMAWLYRFFDIQETSNIIGVYDLAALVVLAIGIHIRALFWPGILLCSAVFLTTQTFLFSYPGSWVSLGLLSSSGIFIIKDLWFLANLLIMIDIQRRLACT